MEGAGLSREEANPDKENPPPPAPGQPAKMINGSWRDGSAEKSIGCSSRGLPEPTWQFTASELQF